MLNVPYLVFILLLTVGMNVKAGYQIETLVEGLEYPHGLAFLPGGDVLITEKKGRLRVFSGGVLLPDPVKGVPDVYFDHYSGLLDIILHPRFSENRFVYLSLTQGSSQFTTLHILRGKYEAGQLKEVRKILSINPVKNNAIFFGARMEFLSDETLLFTVGDGYDTREEAQNLGSLLGKIIRITDEGKIPGDNPFVNTDKAAPEIWSYGLRNVLGISYDHKSNTVYAHDNGPWGGDELNIMDAGKNYGWPFASYGMDYSGAYVTPLKEYPGTEQPILQWTPSLAPSGLTICRKCQWPEWEGDLFIGMLAGQQVKRVRVRSDKVVEQETVFEKLNERIRDLRFSPNGVLYILTDGAKGRLLKVTAN